MSGSRLAFLAVDAVLGGECTTAGVVGAAVVADVFVGFAAAFGSVDCAGIGNPVSFAACLAPILVDRRGGANDAAGRLAEFDDVMDGQEKE